ncbi:MAG: hypothetical protein AAGK97_00200 [Bacteroidota bacterium]
MQRFKFCFIYFLLLTFSTSLFAHHPYVNNPRDAQRNEQVTYRADCNPSRAAIDQNINNVRARLLAGGDVWWDLSDGKYIVPNVDPESGLPEVSSLFAGSVWLGGIGDGDNLKMAAQTYRQDGNDFWPGPLDPVTGDTEPDTCRRWDRHFRVLGSNIDLHRKNFEKAMLTGAAYTEEMIPEDVLEWPGRLNPYFASRVGFELPNTRQGLGAFFDRSEDGVYDPVDGDFPIIEVRGCPKPLFPDEMIFWIYNDAGGIHTQTQGNALRMEVQVQAFAFAANDQINDMTFQRYKLINRSSSDLDSTFFAMWVDPDLGCHTDDYVGCDVGRSLAYVYNDDQLDGETGCACPGGVATYCDRIPMVGVDYFRGPLKPFFKIDSVTGLEVIDTSVELGMSSFTYYNNGGIGNPLGPTIDPGVAEEYYNYISGSWRDGTRLTRGGSGYNVGSTDTTSYAFPDPPNDPNGWSMVTAGLDFGDRRTIQASGPFRLRPGAVNELIVGAVWVPDVIHDRPSLDKIFAADDLAQALFDNCFEITDGPDAPDLDFIELDRELICVLSNDELTSNNAFENYMEKGLTIPDDEADSLYVFEGYLVYQLRGPEVTTGELDDPTKALPIFQVDVSNGVQRIYNWSSISDPNPVNPDIWFPEEQVNGSNDGIEHSFSITRDFFAEEDTRLVNHKKYYYTAIAYAYNNYEQFDPREVTGQRQPYLEGRRNIETYVPIPRPINFRGLNAQYGDGVQITRLAGQGLGGNFIDMENDMYEQILSGNFDGSIEYEQGAGPIDVKIFNPLEVKDGEYILRIIDNDINDDVLDNPARWEVFEVNEPGNVITAERSIDRLNEQLISEFGFSVSIAQTGEAGDLSEGNGVIGADIEQLDEAAEPWLNFVPDGEPGQQGFFDFVKTGFVNAEAQADQPLDPAQNLTNDLGGTFYPYQIIDYRANGDDDAPFYLTPAWKNGLNSRTRSADSLASLRNVDIVFTSNKDDWSRCIVVETAISDYTDEGFPSASENMELKTIDSKGKDGNNDGDGTGMSWFPGYAVDVETGERLNIFFGENGSYTEDFNQFYQDEINITQDMLFNPSDQFIIQEAVQFGLFAFFLGGQHYVYVTNTEYDSCADLRTRLTAGGSDFRKLPAIRSIQWAGMPILQQNASMESIENGLIPSDVIVKLRVDNPYQTKSGSEASSHPTYTFTIDGAQADDLTTESQIDSALMGINVAPNPYYAYSEYETSQFTTTVKITNLPPKCTVTIFSLDGRFIRQYARDEVPELQNDRNNPPILARQVTPDIEWDLKNSKGIPIASGVYLIHVDAPGLGERVIKWFGVNRKFDPTGL